MAQAARLSLFSAFAALASAPGSAEEDLQLAYNNRCRECHSVQKGDNRLGPSLYAIVGRKAGTVEGYRGYSPALHNSSIVWTEDMLDKWIADPNAVASGNSMSPPYGGIADAGERAKIIAYLKSEKAGGSGAEPAPKAD